MEGAVAFLLVVDIVALVFTTVGPLEHAGALHFVVAPHAFVLATIRPVVNTCEQRVKFSSVDAIMKVQPCPHFNNRAIL